MRKSILLAAVALAVAACTDSPTLPDPGEAVLSHQGSHALFDLTTPVLDGSESGGTVSLSWTPTDLQADCDAAAAANLLNPDDVWWGVHFEVYRNGEKIAEPTEASYEDSGLADGSYTYYVKSKAWRAIPGRPSSRTTAWTPTRRASRWVVVKRLQSTSA